MAKATGSESLFTVRSSEVDSCGRATMPALVSYMQEAAWNNTADLGISMYALLEQGLTWVLQRMRIEMFRYPTHTERIKVATWASGREKVFLHRDFRIYSSGEGSEPELLGQATSVWLVMDVVKRQLVSVPDFIMAQEIAPDAAPLPFAKGKLPPLHETLYTQQLPVRWHDIDLNQHVTNTRYLQWALDTLPEEVLKQQLREIDIIFRAESILGDTIASEVGTAAPTIYLHKLSSQQSGKELVQAKTVWESL